MIWMMRIRGLLLILIVSAVLSVLIPQTAHGQSSSPDVMDSPLSTSSAQPQTMSYSDFRVLLNSVLREHVYLSAEALKAGADNFGSDKFKVSTKALDDNSITVASAVTDSFSSPELKAQFLALWRKHIDDYFYYMLASKANNQQLKNQAEGDLKNVAGQMADLMSQNDQVMPKSAVMQMLNDHGKMVLGSIDAYTSGDYGTAESLTHQAYIQMGQAADSIAQSILKVNPNKYSASENLGQID